jgi:hypothetical protein
MAETVRVPFEGGAVEVVLGRPHRKEAATAVAAHAFPGGTHGLFNTRCTIGANAPIGSLR